MFHITALYDLMFLRADRPGQNVIARRRCSEPLVDVLLSTL